MSSCVRTNIFAPAALPHAQKRPSAAKNQRLRTVCRAEDDRIVTLLDYGMFVTWTLFTMRQ